MGPDEIRVEARKNQMEKVTWSEKTGFVWAKDQQPVHKDVALIAFGSGVYCGQRWT